MKYSIIVPVYNTSKYLNRCIDSILSQTYDQFELLLIDDGSTDNSFRLCVDYCKIDKRIRVYKKSNGGVSSARNLGLQMAKGENIIFIDSDDYVEPTLLETVSSFNEDLIVYNSELNGCQMIIQKNLDKDFFSGDLKDKILYFPVNKVFSSKIIKDNKLEFEESIKIGEDMLFCYDYLRCSNSIRFLDEKLYHYVVRNDSSMNNSNKDYLQFYISTFQAVKSRIGNNIPILSFFALKISSIILVRNYLKQMSYKRFKGYMLFFEKTDIRRYLILCKKNRTLSKKTLIFLIKHKLYWFLHKAIKIKANGY